MELVGKRDRAVIGWRISCGWKKGGWLKITSQFDMSPFEITLTGFGSHNMYRQERSPHLFIYTSSCCFTPSNFGSAKTNQDQKCLANLGAVVEQNRLLQRLNLNLQNLSTQIKPQSKDPAQMRFPAPRTMRDLKLKMPILNV